jgi:hypothetical protein
VSRRQILVVGLSSALALAIGEVGLRVAWRNPYRAELPERVLRIRMQHANVDNLLDRRAFTPQPPAFVRYRTDARSYLLPSARFERPDATIVFLGGSTTECSLVPEPLRFPARVSTLFEERGRRVNTLNAGRAANTTQDAINLLFNHVSEDHPDIAVLMEATNDIGVLKGDGSYRSRMAQIEGGWSTLRWPLQRFSAHLAIAGLLRQAIGMRGQGAPGGDPAFGREEALLPTEGYAAHLRIFVQMARALGAVPVLMTQPVATVRTERTPAWHDPANQARFNDVVREVAREQGATLVDLERRIRAVPGWETPMKIFYDGMHVTDEGSALYAQYAAEALEPLVLRPR